MKTLVVHYSRTGNTSRIAEVVASRLGADTEHIFEVSDARRGLLGWARSSVDALLRNTPALRPLDHDPAEYDMVVVGTPVWWGAVCAPIRTFLLSQRPLPRHVAFFCTCGGRGTERTFRQMARLSGRAPIATLVVRERELAGGEHSPRLDDFVAKLSRVEPPKVRPNGPSRVSRM